MSATSGDLFMRRLQEAERRDDAASAASTIRAESPSEQTISVSPAPAERCDTDTRRSHTYTSVALDPAWLSIEKYAVPPRRRARIISKELDAAVRTAVAAAQQPQVAECRARAVKLRQSDFASTMFWPEAPRGAPTELARPRSARLWSSRDRSSRDHTPHVPGRPPLAAGDAKAAAHGLHMYYTFGRQALGPSAPSTHRR